MALTEITCVHCGKKSMKSAGTVNRSRKLGWPIYCGRACAGLARRLEVPKTPEQKKAEKQAYDAQRRIDKAEELKAAKREYYRLNHDPVREAEQRKKRMPYHVEYCRRPEVRAKKHVYDVTRGAKERYGEFWECFLLSQQIHEAAVEKAGGKYELLLAKGYFDRSTIKRRRDYERFDREEPEVGALGDLERRERR